MSSLCRAGLALAIVATAGTAAAGVNWGADHHNSHTQPLPPEMRVNSNDAAANFLAVLEESRVMSFEASQGVSASHVYPAPSSGMGVNPAIDFGGGVTATIRNAIVRFQTPGTAGPDSQPSGRYGTDGAHYLVQTAPRMTLEFNSAQSAFGFWGIDIGDFGGLLTVTLTGEGGSRSFEVAPESGGGQASGSVLFWSFFDPAFTFSTVTFDNSRMADVFAYDQFTVGRLIPAPAGAMALAAIGALAAARRRR